MTSAERSTMISSMLEQCSEDTRLSIVVYGIPNKDCDAGYSSGGSVKSTDDYKTFLKELTDAVGDRKVLYVVEPDAVGLLAKEGSCGSSAGHLDNLKLYVDVGYWVLADSAKAAKIAPIMKELGSSGNVKGVTINTSNYRSNDECATYCTNFQAAMGKSAMTCIVDTSRNYNGSPTSDWCNVPTAGIGKPPASKTGISNLDYFMWIKPPRESDGECNGGTSAGSFFADGFTKPMDQGYFVKEGGMKSIADGTGDVNQTSSESSDQTSSKTEAPAASSNVDQTSSTMIAPQWELLLRQTPARPRALQLPLQAWMRTKRLPHDKYDSSDLNADCAEHGLQGQAA
ncbi:glycosyl hydrolase family 6 protein [Phytophthora sojae]|uniref:Glycosyl hydrolase family 6 protein n=1 Tax=Phytophthora sojae (strain P6497) TaxID=1094619 RepID=G4ZXL9_PHYSP|nr:glycosyl hydrolase family 6 protein [Phytophthora sojae]EGZ12582.1 glycosyl hydrolase family 6 protein [Phytophthora sojae]|eukprot:XP_009532915.1 glycosyl hydrolase family 6 protein [Phytophthora sojae]